MKDFYPVMVKSNKNSIDNGRLEVKEASGNTFIDILFIDHKGIVADKQILTAILNGRPILIEDDTNVKINPNSDKTIDI